MIDQDVVKQFVKQAFAMALRGLEPPIIPNLDEIDVHVSTVSAPRCTWSDNAVIPMRFSGDVHFSEEEQRKRTARVYIRKIAQDGAATECHGFGRELRNIPN